MKKTTLAMIKPDGVKRKLVGECIKRIESEGLEIIDIKVTRFNKKKAAEFRKEIKEKHPIIYDDLIEYMTEGPMIAMIISGDDAIDRLRRLCGPTNSKDAPKGTIRGDFGKGDMRDLYKKGKVIKNVIHASGNEKEAKEEIMMVFG